MQFLKYNDIFAVLSTVCLALFWTQYQQLKSDLKYEANLLNKTHQSNESIVIFNRVPKCGSESLHKIMEILSAKNNFTVYDDEHTKKGVEITYLAEKSDRKAFVDMFYKEPNLKLPCVYTKHANFLEFEEFNQTTPIYINIVRDPVERILSWYYYTRQNWYIFSYDQYGNHYLNYHKSIKQLKSTFQDCLIKKGPDCHYPSGTKVHYGPYGDSHFSQVKNNVFFPLQSSKKLLC